MDRGWFKLHRKITENPNYKNPKWVSLWIFLLSEASHEERKEMLGGVEISVKPGQFTTGRQQISRAIGVSETTVERLLSRMESGQQIGQRKTSTNRLITINNWDEYQKSGQQSGQQTDNEWTTNGQQTDTLKELKNERMKENTEDNLVELDKIVKVWNSFADATGVPAINGLSKSRVAKLRARNINIELLVKILERAMKSDFLTGKSGRWKMTFDWLFANDTNYNKVMEGNYDNQESVSRRRMFEFEREAKGKYDHLA